MLGVLFYWACAYLAKAVFTVFSRWEVTGTANVPAKGPLIVIGNHLSNIDPVLLSASLSRRICFMAKEELFRPFWLRPFVYLYGAFPVHRGQPDRKALRQAARILESGKALGMFPEGTRSRTNRVQQGHPGTSLVALRSNAMLLPLGITGTEKINGLKDVLSRHTITVDIGKPFHLRALGLGQAETDLVALTAEIMEHIAELLPESYGGRMTATRSKGITVAKTGFN